MTIYELINGLMQYGINNNLYDKEDYNYILNSLLKELKLDIYKENDYKLNLDLESLLVKISNYALKHHLISKEKEELFKTRLMGILLPLPSLVNERFLKLKAIDSNKALFYLYNLEIASNYLPLTRINQNLNFTCNSEYGNLKVCINLAKNENKKTKLNYPKCRLCKENVNYSGRDDYPSRENLRFVSLILNNEKFYFQYSPYSYFPTHFICFKDKHVKMDIDLNTIKELLDFVDQFKDCFIGSNCSLPLIGGSILSHYHFQGGKEKLPIFYATGEFIKKKNKVKYYLLNWPMNVIRLVSKDKKRLINEANKVMEFWNNYCNEELLIINKDSQGIHNGINPVCYFKDNHYELNIILRNNYTSKSRPFGIYNTSEKYWNIKSGNIGIIEVMGLAVLDSKVKDELEIVKKYLLKRKLDKEEKNIIVKHQELINRIILKGYNEENINLIIKEEIGETFKLILEDCAVFSKEKINILKSLIKVI